MALEIIGKVVKLLPEQSGTSNGKSWTKREFVVETEEQYPKKICFSAWGDKVADINRFSVGQSIKVYFDVQSREYNEKWYTDLRAWRIEANNSNATSSAETTHTATTPAPISTPLESSSTDDLPF